MRFESLVADPPEPDQGRDQGEGAPRSGKPAAQGWRGSHGPTGRWLRLSSDRPRASDGGPGVGDKIGRPNPLKPGAVPRCR